jgi:hypothetical protein
MLLSFVYSNFASKQVFIVSNELCSLESTHHFSTVFEQTEFPVLICGRLLQRLYHKTQSFFGLMIRWFCCNSSSSDTFLKLVLLSHTPLQLKCFQTSLLGPGRMLKFLSVLLIEYVFVDTSTQFKPAATLSYVCILNDTGQVEVRNHTLIYGKQECVRYGR